MLITGGPGSFGCRVASHLMNYHPREIRVFSRDEKKQYEMKRVFPDFVYVIGDVRDRARVLSAMRSVDYVFHAAALKQVPACEEAPYEAVKTNVIGSQNVCEAAIACNVRCLVALSTDKAVKPVNAMGMSKALMEKLVCAYNRDAIDTKLCCVRYGNVMGSRGSVIPLFRELIARNEPLILTVPNMTRFLLTLDESVDLVFRALNEARGGEIFVRKAPACTVGDLADAMRRKYSPLRSDHQMRIIGSRAGEKLHEVLVNEYEMQRCTQVAAYFTIEPEYRRPSTPSAAPIGSEYTSENTERVTDYDHLSKLLDRAESLESYA